jgi:hypothetical protein
MNLIRVRHDLPQGIFQVRLQRNVFTDQALKHGRGLPDRPVQVKHSWFDDLLSTKSQ